MIHSSTRPFVALCIFLLSSLGANANISKSEALSEAQSKPSGAEVFFDHQSGTFDYWVYYRQLLGNGQYHLYTVKRDNVQFNGARYFIPISTFEASSDCPYEPEAYRLRVDPRRSVFRSNGEDRCNRSFFALGGEPTTTKWKYCDSDQYVSCSFWECSCKGEGSVDVVVYDGQGNILDPGEAGYNQLCAPGLPTPSGPAPGPAPAPVAAPSQTLVLGCFESPTGQKICP